MRDAKGQLISQAEQQTQRALELPKGKPEENFRRASPKISPWSTFPGQKAKALRGQLDIDGNVAQPSSSPRNRGKERA